MPTVLLIRHGRTAANAAAILAGRAPGVCLDDEGKAQARALAQHVAPIPLERVITSPLERTQETAAYVVDAQIAMGRSTHLHVDERFSECDYGSWSGEALSTLAEQELWRTVQQHPSAAHFPGGEAMRSMQDRALEGIRSWNQVSADSDVYAVVSHGDVIKAVLADALGMHFDNFQRLSVEPASVSVVRYTALRPFVLRLNDTQGEWRSMFDVAPTTSDAVVGGGSS